MSKRRMFSQDIVLNDVFLDMPLSSQALYMHLSMNADDYGFVSPKRIMRMIGAAEDDLKVLIAKRYVLTFESGVVVIKHWQVNNTVRKDRSHMTTFEKEYKSLIRNEFGAYTERRKIFSVVSDVEQATTRMLEETEVGNQPATDGKPNGNQMATEIRLDKIRLDKTRIVTKVTMGDAQPKKRSQKTQQIDGMFEYWETKVGLKITAKVKQNREYAGKLLADYTKEEIAQLIHAAALASEDRYAPRVVNFIDLYRKADDLKHYGKKHITAKVKGKSTVIS